MTVEWTNLSSGLLGALIGFAGSVLLHWRSNRSNRRAAARAVLAEIFTNAALALSAESTRVYHEFLDAAWRTQLPLVAQLLKWPELKGLVGAYDSGARAYENGLDVLGQLKDEERRAREYEERLRNEGSPLTTYELKWDEKLERMEEKRRMIDQWFRDVANEWIEAMRVLRNAAVGRNESKVFDEDLRKLEERLKSANVKGKLG